MRTSISTHRKHNNGLTVLEHYDVAADNKKRINLRGAKTKYFHVKALSNGCYLLEPRMLVPPAAIPARTLKALKRSAENLRKEKAVAPVTMPELPPGESLYDKALPILKRAWARNRNLPGDLATNSKYLESFGA